MIAVVRSELRKFFTTRMWWGMAIAVVLSGIAFAALNGFFLTSDAAAQAGVATQTDAELARTVYTGGLQVAYLLTLAIGVLTIGSEYRHKTITATFLAVPKRTRVLGAKVVALLGIGAGYGALALASSFAVGAVILASKGHPVWPDATIGRTLALGLLVLGLWGLIGLGIGILIPNQIAALFIAVGVAWIVEPLLTFLLSTQEWGSSLARFFPSSATTAVLGASNNGGGGVTLATFEWWGGALILIAYAAVMAVIGTALTVRRDVT
ncbi:MAG: ABC transporter permease [Dermatophilaceae bacterium]